MEICTKAKFKNVKNKIINQQNSEKGNSTAETDHRTRQFWNKRKCHDKITDPQNTIGNPKIKNCHENGRKKRPFDGLVVVELEAHAIVDLVILEGDMILVDGVPLLDADLVGPGARLCRHELLQVADGVVVVALHTHLLPQSIVQHHLDHLLLPSIPTLKNPNPQISIT